LVVDGGNAGIPEMTFPGQGSGPAVTQFEVQLAANQKAAHHRAFDGASLAFNPACILCSNPRLEAELRMLAKCVLV